MGRFHCRKRAGAGRFDVFILALGALIFLFIAVLSNYLAEKRAWTLAERFSAIEGGARLEQTMAEMRASMAEYDIPENRLFIHDGRVGFSFLGSPEYYKGRFERKGFEGTYDMTGPLEPFTSRRHDYVWKSVVVPDSVSQDAPPSAQ